MRKEIESNFLLSSLLLSTRSPSTHISTFIMPTKQTNKNKTNTIVKASHLSNQQTNQPTNHIIYPNYTYYEVSKKSSANLL